MSMGALLTAVRQQLWNRNGWKRNECDVLDEPPATAGEFFVTIGEGTTTSTEKSSLREEMGVTVTVWHRTGLKPKDRAGDYLLANMIGVDLPSSQVKAAIHNQHDLRALANEAARAPGIGGDIFTIPLFYRNCDKAVEAVSGPNGKEKTWITRVLHFGGAIRLQSLSAMK